MHEDLFLQTGGGENREAVEIYNDDGTTPFLLVEADNPNWKHKHTYYSTSITKTQSPLRE